MYMVIFINGFVMNFKFEVVDMSKMFNKGYVLLFCSS